MQTNLYRDRARRYPHAPLHVLLALLLLAASACEVPQEQEPGDGSTPPVRVLTEHRPVASSYPPDKQVGEDCTAHGYTECISGLCLHAVPIRGQGYFCSKSCLDSSECPRDWRCVQVMPGSSGPGVCQPPAGWVSAPAESAPAVDESRPDAR